MDQNVTQQAAQPNRRLSVAPMMDWTDLKITY
jgi:tRNA-dihydrouridine synthase